MSECSKKVVYILLICLIMVVLGAANSFAQYNESILYGKTIVVGVEESVDWAPFEFIGKNDDIQSNHVEGFSIDVLNEILTPYNVKLEYSFYPWKRCLEYLMKGEHLQIILPTSLTAERRNKYLFTDYVYEVTPAYFYLKSNRLKLKPISEAHELYSFGSICGKSGYNYQNFGIDSKRVDRGASTFKALIGKLKGERCTVVLARFEIIAASHLVGENLLTQDIEFRFVPNVDKERFHFIITKNTSFSRELVDIINQGVKEMRKSGRLKEILDKYL